MVTPTSDGHNERVPPMISVCLQYHIRFGTASTTVPLKIHAEEKDETSGANKARRIRSQTPACRQRW